MHTQCCLFDRVPSVVDSVVSKIEELTDQLRLGENFYVLGYSMAGQIIWSCLYSNVNLRFLLH